MLDSVYALKVETTVFTDELEREKGVKDDTKVLT